MLGSRHATKAQTSRRQRQPGGVDGRDRSPWPRGSPDPGPAVRGLVTYDAKDPDTVPADRAAPPARRRAERADGPARRRRVRRVERVRWPVKTPTAERLAGDGLKYNRFHTTALCSPTGRRCSPAATTTRSAWAASPRSPPRRPATTRCGRTPPRRWRRTQAQRLLDRPVRQVPRGAGLGDQPDGPVRPLAHGRRRSSTSTASSAARPTSGRRSTRTRCRSNRPDAGGGLSPHRGHGRPRDRLDAPAEGADARQALLHLLRARRDPRAASCAAGMGDRYRGQFDQGWDGLREQTLARQKALGVIPQEAELTTRPRRSRPGTTCRTTQAGARPPDGGLRRLPRAHRSPHRSSGRCSRGARVLDNTLDLLHHRRQRRLGRRHAARHASTR